jgi:hypothetical protein
MNSSGDSLLVSFTATSRVKVQASLWGIYGGQSGTRTGCAAVSPVTIIPAVLHAHSFFMAEAI